MRDGNWSIFLTLALCLAVTFGGTGIVFAGALASIAASRLLLLPQAAKLYVTDWLRSDAFALNLLITVVAAAELGLILYHGDDLGDYETQLKQYLAALAVLLTIRRFPVETVLWGAAIGCLLGSLVAFHELFIDGMSRADGPTNAIRFGMVGALLAVLSWTGALFGRLPLPARLFMGAAALAGIFVMIASGARGAAIALPFMLLVLVPRIWRARGRPAILVGVAFLLFAAAAAAAQLVFVRYGFSAVQQATERVISGDPVEDRSTIDRVTMLQIAKDLFVRHPAAGGGESGWRQAVADHQASTSSREGDLRSDYNQPHNQYANDFAKGGLLRGLGGLAMLLVPMLLFLRRRPFSLTRQSLPALLGVVTCTAYAIFGLTESVMDLSLTGSLYAILVFYLIASAEGAPPIERDRLQPEQRG